MKSTSKNSRFQKGSGCFTCESCGRKTRSTGRGDNELVNICAECYDEGGIENEHLDGHHFDKPCENCPMCREQAQKNATKPEAAPVAPKEVKIQFKLIGSGGSLGVVAESKAELAKWILTADLEPGDRIEVVESFED